MLRFTCIVWFTFVLENGVRDLGNDGNCSSRLADKDKKNERRLKVVKCHSLWPLTAVFTVYKTGFNIKICSRGHAVCLYFV